MLPKVSLVLLVVTHTIALRQASAFVPPIMGQHDHNKKRSRHHSTTAPAESPAPRKLSLPPFEDYVQELLDKHNLSVTFSSEIETAALGAIQGNETMVAPDAAPLVDLTDRPYVTVDNDDSMDLDQAIFIAPWYGPPPRRGRSNGDDDDDEEGGLVRPRSGVKNNRQPEHYLVSYMRWPMADTLYLPIPQSFKLPWRGVVSVFIYQACAFPCSPDPCRKMPCLSILGKRDAPWC
jgi:hypothetical protein